MKAWYFSGSNCRLRYGDGREIKPGITHTVEGKPVLCESGLHASIKPLDALDYAPGPYVWRVELGGEIVRGDGKCVATERTYLWGFDATDTLRKFARMCALDVIHLWDAPDIVERYLRTGDESLRTAAWSAAWSAARAAAWSAAWSAARGAAWSAARGAAWDAAWGETWSAARGAARAAAWAAAWSAAWSAARGAAWSAARGAAWDAQSRRLYRMLMAGRRA